MAFYVSAIDGRKKALLVGPYRRHGDALADVKKVRKWAADNTREGKWGGVAYGTARDKTRHDLGRFNDHVGVEVDSDGWVGVAA